MNRRERRSEAAIEAKSRRAKERKPAGEGGAGLIPDTRRFGSKALARRVR